MSFGGTLRKILMETELILVDQNFPDMVEVPLI